MSNLSVLKRRDFRRYYISSVAGVNGMWIFRVLLSWSAWDVSGSAKFVGLIAALSLLPVAFVGPFFGTLVDRISIRKAFVAVSFGLMLCPFIFVLLSLTGALGRPGLTALALFFGFAVSAYHPVRQSIGPRLVEGPDVGAVVALSALNFNIGRMVSPVIGGVVIAAAGTTLTGVISVLLFFPNLAIVAGLSPRDLPARTPGHFLAELWEGAGEVWRRPTAWRAMIMASFGLGPIRALTEVLPILADGTFGQGAKGLGFLTSCIGAGALVAAVLQVMAGHRLIANRVLPWLVLGLGFSGTAAMVWVPSFVGVAMASTLNGFASAYLAVWLQTTMQSDLPDRLRGRVMSLWMLSVTLSTSVLAFLVSAGSEIIGLSMSMTVFLIVGMIGLAVSVLRI